MVIFIKQYCTSCLLLIAGVTFSVWSYAAPEWRNAGSIQLREGTEKASLSFQYQGEFDRLRLTIMHGTVTLTKMTLHLENGKKLTVPIQKNMASGQHTRPFPLTTASQKAIKKVDIFYRIHQQARPPAQIKAILMAG